MHPRLEVDDLVDTEESNFVVSEHRARIYLVTRRPVRITTFQTYINGMATAWTFVSNGPALPSSTEWFPQYTTLCCGGMSQVVQIELGNGCQPASSSYVVL